MNGPESFNEDDRSKISSRKGKQINPGRSHVHFDPDILQQQSELERERKTTIRNLSSVVLSNAFGEDETQKQIRIDAERLERAVQDAGLYAYGISAVEVWMLNDETGQLVRPGFRKPMRAAGWWTNPNMPRTDALSRLDDPTHDDYDDPTPCPPGCDLAGILYANQHYTVPQSKLEILLSDKEVGETTKPGIEASHPLHEMQINSSEGEHPVIHQPRNAIPRKHTRQHRKTKSAPCEDFSFVADIEHPGTKTDRPIQTIRSETPKNIRSRSANLLNHQTALFFRDIDSLLRDPDSAKTHRLSLIKDAGFTHATGVHFHTGGVQGIVIYYTNRSDLNHHLGAGNVHIDTTLANEFYLFRATELIGSVVACIDARRAITVMTKSILASSLDFLAETSESIDFESNPDDSKPKSKIKKAVTAWWSKCHGAKFQVPPVFAWGEAFFTFAGAFISLLIMAAINILLVDDEGLSISVGPLSSAIAAQYLLTSAPASQPRTIVIGFLVSGCIAMLFTFIPTWFVPIWLRSITATASAIFAMGKIGVYFPPAAGFAFGVTAGHHDVADWLNYIATVGVSMVLVVPSICINNLNRNRQYPIYWGPLIFKMFPKKQVKE